MKSRLPAAVDSWNHLTSKVSLEGIWRHFYEQVLVPSWGRLDENGKHYANAKLVFLSGALAVIELDKSDSARIKNELAVWAEKPQGIIR